MEIDEDYENSKFKIVNVLTYRDRVCVLVKVLFMKRYNGYYSYNGYVSLKKPGILQKLFKIPYEKSYSMFESLAIDGLTYDGYLGTDYRKRGSTSPYIKLIPEDLYFFGFDTLHAHNNEENSSYEAVLRKTMNLADNMIKEGI